MHLNVLHLVKTLYTTDCSVKARLMMQGCKGISIVISMPDSYDFQVSFVYSLSYHESQTGTTKLNANNKAKH